MKKNKLTIIVAIVVILLIVGIVFVISSKNKSGNNINNDIKNNKIDKVDNNEDNNNEENTNNEENVNNNENIDNEDVDNEDVDNENIDNEDVDNKEDIINEINIDGISINLVSNLIGISNFNLSSSFFVYQNQKVSTSNIDDKVYYGSALNLIDMDKIGSCTAEMTKRNPNCDFVVNSKTLINKSKEIYGYQKDSLPKQIYGNGYLNCTLNGTDYECVNHIDEEETINDYTNYFGNVDYVNVKKYVKAEESLEYLYVYEKYINLRLDSSNSNNTYTFSLYKYSNTNDKLIDDKVVVGNEYFQDKEKTFEDKILEKYENEASLFKHTFKKQSDGNYVYISTEEVK